MSKRLLALTAAFIVSAHAADDELPAYPRVMLETTEGSIVVELDSRRAPLTVRRFLTLVEAGTYDGTIFHRVIPNFMIQAGGFNRDFEEVEEGEPLFNESGNGLTNLRGTIAMARMDAPHTAGAQFFINVADNRSLNPRADRWGYAVFGYVIEGMDVVDAIAAARTGPGGRFSQDVPVAAIVIERATRSDLEQ